MQARRTRLREVSAEKQQGPVKGYKYLPNGALAPGQKRYPVQCPPGTSHGALAVGHTERSVHEGTQACIYTPP